jgi:hypothetical protein
MELLRFRLRLPLPLALLLLLAAPLARAPRAAVPVVPGGDVVTRAEVEAPLLLPPAAGWQIVATAGGGPAHPDAERTLRDLPLAGRARPHVVPRLRRSAPAEAARAPVRPLVLQSPRSVRAPPFPG